MNSQIIDTLCKAILKTKWWQSFEMPGTEYHLTCKQCDGVSPTLVTNTPKTASGELLDSIVHAPDCPVKAALEFTVRPLHADAFALMSYQGAMRLRFQILGASVKDSVAFSGEAVEMLMKTEIPKEDMVAAFKEVTERGSLY